MQLNLILVPVFTKSVTTVNSIIFVGRLRGHSGISCVHGDLNFSVGVICSSTIYTVSTVATDLHRYVASIRAVTKCPRVTVRNSSSVDRTRVDGSWNTSAPTAVRINSSSAVENVPECFRRTQILCSVHFDG